MLVCGGSLLALGIHLIDVGRNWPLGDWLINYEGGFVRRGLSGESLLLLSHLLCVDPIVFAVAICLLCYVVLFVALWNMISKPPLSWWKLYVLLSPATLTFPLLSTRAGFHKEVLLYAALAVLLWVYRGEQTKVAESALSAGLAVLCVILTLSHEPLVFYLPYLFVVPLLASKSVRSAVFVCAPSIVCSLASFIFVLQHIGTPSIVSSICESVRNGTDRCADPIRFLMMTRSGQLALMRETANQFHYLRIFPALILLSAVPVLMAIQSLSQRAACRRLLLQTLFACAIAISGSFTLFRFGPDWGRWVSMHAMCLMLLLLWIDRRSWVPSKSSIGVQLPTQRRRWASASLTIGLLLYSTCWSMPGFGDTPLHGILGLLLHRP